MRNTLLLRKDPGNESVWRWLQLDDEGRPQGSVHAGALTDAASEAPGQRIVVLVSGADCLLTRVSIPGGSRQKLLRAVPYALEEQLSEEVENLHFAARGCFMPRTRRTSWWTRVGRTGLLFSAASRRLASR